MVFTFAFLDIGQFTAARTLLVEATAYILLSIILSEAIDLWDSHRLSRGARVKLTGLTTRKVLKTLVDVFLIVAAVTSELRTDVVPVREGASDARLVQNQRAFASTFSSLTNGSEAQLRRLDRSLTGRIGLCDWRTNIVDGPPNWSVFQGEGYGNAVRLADSLRSGVAQRSEAKCAAQKMTSLARYQLGEHQILVSQGVVTVSDFEWGAPEVLQGGGDTKTASARVEFTVRNRTTIADADLMCTAYVRPDLRVFDAREEGFVAGLRNNTIRGLQCGGLLSGGSLEAGEFQDLIMFHLSVSSDYLPNDRVQTENFLTLQTDQNMEVSEIYLASRSITPGFLTYERRMRFGVTVVMADRLVQDIVEGTYQVCSGGCDGFQVVTSSKLAAQTDFLIEIVLMLVVLFAGIATTCMSIYLKKFGDLGVMSPLDRILDTHLGDKSGATPVRHSSAHYISVSRVGTVEAGDASRAPIKRATCTIEPM